LADRTTQLFDVLQMIATVGMTWWVSATVLCASIIGGVWVRRRDLRGFGRVPRHGFFILVFVFICSVIAFGLVLICASMGLGSDLQQACVAIRRSDGCSASDASTLQSGMVWGFAIGTSSFVVTGIAWIGVWIEISRTANRRSSQLEPKTRAEAN
jgi:hypothetical protein